MYCGEFVPELEYVGIDRCKQIRKLQKAMQKQNVGSECGSNVQCSDQAFHCRQAGSAKRVWKRIKLERMLTRLFSGAKGNSNT